MKLSVCFSKISIENNLTNIKINFDSQSIDGEEFLVLDKINATESFKDIYSKLNSYQSLIKFATDEEIISKILNLIYNYQFEFNKLTAQLDLNSFVYNFNDNTILKINIIKNKAFETKKISI